MNAVDPNNDIASFHKDFVVTGPGIPEPHPFLSFSYQISPTSDQGLGDGYFLPFKFLLAKLYSLPCKIGILQLLAYSYIRFPPENLYHHHLQLVVVKHDVCDPIQINIYA